MITKYDLQKYKDIRAEVKQLEEQIEELNLSRIVPSCQHLTGMPIYHSVDHDKIGNIIAKAEKLYSLYVDKMEKLLTIQLEIEVGIACLEHEEQRLIRLYYFNDNTWEDVAEKMDYTWRHVYRLHSKILKKLAVM